MKRKSAGKEIAALLFAIILILSGILYIRYHAEIAPKKTMVRLYYYDPVSLELVPQNVSLNLPVDETLKVKAIVEELRQPGQNDSLFPPLNKEAKVNSVSINNGICTLDLNEAATNITPLSVRKEAIRVFGIVNTLTELKGINAVQFTIDGKKKKYFSHYIEIDKPLTHLSSALPNGKEVNLYFASPDFSILLIEQREIVSSQNPTTLGKEIIRELLFGSVEGLKNIFPKGVNVNDFYIKSGGIGVVDFDNSILKHPLGSQGEQLFVMSLVNSLTELPDIQSVRILIDGKEIDTLFGSVDTSAPIQRFFGITQDKSVIIPYYVYTVNGKEFFCPKVETEQSNENRIEALFNALKNPPEGMKSYIAKSVELISYKMSPETSTVTLKLDFGAENTDNINKAEKEIALSFTEIPNITRVEIINNGEKKVISR